MSKDEAKASYACFLVYEDSAPENWREVLKDSHGMYAISPRHEPDGECNKHHYHVVYKHGNPITSNCAKRMIPDGVAANGHIELCHHPRQYQRYLLHLDHPEKQQWEGNPYELIETLNGFPLDLSRELSRAELVQMKREITQIIIDYDFMEYCDITDFLLNMDFDMFDYLTSHTLHFGQYLTSRRNKAMMGEVER